MYKQNGFFISYQLNSLCFEYFNNDKFILISLEASLVFFTAYTEKKRLFLIFD